jgi:hypothetical protein
MDEEMGRRKKGSKGIYFQLEEGRLKWKDLMMLVT